MIQKMEMENNIRISETRESIIIKFDIVLNIVFDNNNSFVKRDV